MHYGRISEYEQDKREPTLITLLAYARAASVHLEDIVDDDFDLPRKLPGNVNYRGITRKIQSQVSHKEAQILEALFVSFAPLCGNISSRHASLLHTSLLRRDRRQATFFPFANLSSCAIGCWPKELCSRTSSSNQILRRSKMCCWSILKITSHVCAMAT